MSAKRTYAEFVSPGFFFPETEVIEVKSRDIQTLEIPEHAYTVRFFDILTAYVWNRQKTKKVRAKTGRVNVSYYNIGVRVCTRGQVREETKKKKRLSKEVRESREKMLREMEVNKLKYALKARKGGFAPLKKGELVILLNGKERKVMRVK